MNSNKSNVAERRVIFVNRVYWPDESATAQLLTDLAQALAARGWEVHVIAGGDGPAQHGPVAIHRTGGSNRVASLAARVASYARFLLGARRTLAALVRPGDVVVLKTDPPLLSALATGVVLRRGGRAVQWLQDIYPDIVWAHQGAWLAPLLAPLRAARDAAWRRSHRVVVVGADMRAPVIAARVPPARVAHRPNWAPRELESAPVAADVQARRTRLGWNGRFVVAYSGNLGRVHTFAAMVDAAERLRSERDIAWAIIGGGPRLTEVQAGVAQRRLDSVQFLPPTPRTELAAALAAADVHLVTLRPGFATLVYPSKLAGILASGRPAVFVGPPQAELAVFLEREHCGVVVPPDDGVRLAAVLRRLRDEPEFRAALGSAARQAYERHFRLATAVEAWDTLLRAVRVEGESSLP